MLLFIRRVPIDDALTNLISTLGPDDYVVLAESAVYHIDAMQQQSLPVPLGVIESDAVTRGIASDNTINTNTLAKLAKSHTPWVTF